MLRSDGDSGKVRESHLLSLPYRSVCAEKTRGRKGYVLAMSVKSTGHDVPSREKQSGIKDLRRGCRFSAFTVLDALSCVDSMHDRTPTTNRANTGGRSWRHGQRMDKAQEGSGANWITTLRYLAATGTTARTPVRVARTGTTPHRTRTTTSGRASSVMTQVFRSVNAKASQADQSTCGQPDLSSFGKHASRFSIVHSSEISKGAADFRMAKKHRNLIDKITHIDNLREAYRKTAKGKKMTFGYLEFKEYAEANLLLVQKELQDGTYRIGEYRQFTIYEPKPRLISALEFKDRLVQHALCNVVAPIFEKTLLPQTFACRAGMGTHAGVKFVQSRLRHTDAKYFLKTDYSKFFPSVDRQILHKMINRKIACEKTLKILREIIPTEGKGIPIGSLTSQLFANIYGNAVDRFIHFELGHRHWARYMDDIVIMDDGRDKLIDTFLRINDWSMANLKLRIGKWQVSSTSRGINFLGYRIWKTHKLLRKDSVIRAKRKITRFVSTNDDESMGKFIASWSGHAKWADTHNLFKWLEKKHGITI